VILYEMASGKRAFTGVSSVEVMNSILKDEPQELPPASPQALDRIVRRCIEKNPARRFQSAADLGFALQSLSASVAPAPTPKRRSRKTAIALLVSGLLLLAAVAEWSLFRPRTTTDSVQLTGVPLTAETGWAELPSFSPDGNQVAYGGTGNDLPNGKNRRIYVKSVGSGNPLQLTPAGRVC
jgi:serine/threonine protein kinase